MCKLTSKGFALSISSAMPPHKRHLHYNNLPHENLLPIPNTHQHLPQSYLLIKGTCAITTSLTRTCYTILTTLLVYPSALPPHKRHLHYSELPSRKVATDTKQKTLLRETKAEQINFKLISSATRLPLSFDFRTVALRLKLSLDLPFRNL